MSKNNEMEVNFKGLPKQDPMVRALDLIERTQGDFKNAYAEAKMHAVSRAKIDTIMMRQELRIKNLQDLISDALERGFLIPELKAAAAGFPPKAREVRLDQEADGPVDRSPEADAGGVPH